MAEIRCTYSHQIEASPPQQDDGYEQCIVFHNEWNTRIVLSTVKARKYSFVASAEAEKAGGTEK